MKWEKTQLGKISKCIQPGPFGTQLHNSDYSATGTPVVMPKDMTEGHIRHSGLVCVADDHLARLRRHQVHYGDIMVARKGDVRKCVFITQDEEGWITGSDCLKVSLDPSTCVSKFIYYQLRSPFIGKWLETISIGATMPSINTGLLSGIEILLPPVPVQKRIADMLSAYDDLIENNRKQIKLLEEAAQRLYKEWFVDLRFPGYENTPIVGGLPEGWRTGTLSDVAKFNRGKVITKDQAINGDVPVVAGGLEPAYYHNTSNAVAPVVTVSGSGANAGFTRMYYENIFASDCSFVDNSGGNEVFFAYCFLKDEKTRIKALQKGSAQPHVYAKDLNAMELVIPDSTTIERFNKSVAPLFIKIGNCEKMMKDLGQARDRLLPKLMSGEMEITNEI